ncbi:pinin [Pieris napi]|uniref:pinin n=1 Tax=Pieris napi TaxID=78633 RepID=UPI001FBAB4B7|nr:pinin [Pieris napi]
MGTEVALSFNSLRTQLENERSSLYKIDENIKKIVQTTGRFSNNRYNASSDNSRGQRQPNRNYHNTDVTKNDDVFKRKHETKTVFSRISAKTADSDGEDEASGPKRSRVSSAVSRELPTRAAVLRAQGDDEQARTRNRRIFGSLLGTLQKFKQEEIVLQTKEDKKAQVERKIEEQARLEKERELKERKVLFAERELKKATIKALEAKVARVQEFEKWEQSQRNLGNFILTKAKPHVYWLPNLNKMSEKAQEKLKSSQRYHEKCMSKKRQELEEELQRIEQRCLRQKAPRAKENNPEANDHASNINPEEAENGNKKRDKFAMDADEKEDSDGEEHPEEKELDQKTDTIKNKMHEDTELNEAIIEHQDNVKDVELEVTTVDNTHEDINTNVTETYNDKSNEYNLDQS